MRIAPELTIYGAAELRAELLAALAATAPGATLTLALDDVCEVDSAGVQLLIAARRHAQASGAQLALTGHSAALLDALALLGLDANADAKRETSDPDQASLS